MNWKHIENTGQLDQIDTDSSKIYVLIYKHSTRCGVSSYALKRLQQEFEKDDELILQFHYLDLLKHRHLSDAIANRYKVTHESPQLLLIKNGVCVYNTSHSDVSLLAVRKFLNEQQAVSGQ